MASGAHNDEKEAEVNLTKVPDSIKSAVASIFGFDIDWEKFTADFQSRYDAISDQVKKQNSNKSEMKCEARRLKSFEAFRDSNAQKYSWWSPSEMAHAGFFHTGIGDSVQCFCCGIVNNKRPLSYPPKKLHVEISADCRFMKGEDVGNISMFEVRVQQPELNHASLQAFTKEEARCQSFTNWPSYAAIQPAQLVSAGFFFTDRRDTVQCFSCGGCLANWKENDDPWKEHAKWFPECEFLKSMKTPEEVKVYINSYKGFEGFTGKDFIHNDWNPLTQTCAANLNIFEDENVRLESFKTWPPNANVSPASLAKWGFFYTGKQDAVRCYTCGICIYSFQPGEDAMTEHLKHNSNCAFLRRVLEIKCGNTDNSSHTHSQQLQLVNQPGQDMDKKELHNTERCFKSHTVNWTDKTQNLRQHLADFYNDSTFSNMLPFPGLSHVSVDLRSLFADMCILLKDVRNRPLRQLTLPELLSELRNITMIEGEAGSGKTALLKKIAILWASGKCPILNRFNLVFYISVSSTERQQSLYDIIRQQLIGSTELLTEETLKEMTQHLNDKVLLLLDDYGLAETTSEAVEELIRSPWNRMTVAVTVNTSASRKVRQYAKNILSIQDFPLFSSLYIFKQLFSHNNSFLENFNLHLMLNTTFKIAFRTPLFAFALCVFWVQNPAKYQSIDFSICMTYLMHKLLNYGTENIEALVLSCGQLALEGIFQDCFEFSQENLDEAGVKSDDALQFGLLSRFTSQRLRPIFKFFHPSFQEYLAGRKMSELLESEDVKKNEKGFSYLQKICTFAGVKGRYRSLLKNSCMHSPKAATMIISHLFSLMSNPKAFAHDGGKNPHLPLLDMSQMDSFSSMINPELSDCTIIRMLLEFAINIANESNFLAHCAPVILQFLKDKNIPMFGQPDLWLLKFLHKYPEGLMLIKSLELHVPRALKFDFPAFWNSEEFKSIWTVPTIDEDYSQAFQLTSDIQKTVTELKHVKSLKVPDLSNFGFDPNHHKLSVLRIKAIDCTIEHENVLGNLMVFSSLANRIELDLLNCAGFLQSIWPITDLYKASIKKLSMKNTEFSKEEQEIMTDLTSLEILQINHMPIPEYILSNIHHFKDLKEVEVECLPGEWDIIGLLPDEFKSLQKIEKLVFKNINMKAHCDKLANMIDHLPNLTSFTIECDYCPEFEKVITSLGQNTKMENLCIKRPMTNNEIIHLASVLPALKNLKILEIDNDYSMKVDVSEIFAQSLSSLEELEEFTFPGGKAAMQTLPCYIQQLKQMPNLSKVYINRRLLTDSSMLELAEVCAGGYLKNLQVLDLNNNMDITQSGYRDLLNVLDQLPKLEYLGMSRPISVQFKTEPITLIALIRCVSKLHHLRHLDIFGWLLDERDMELINEMKSKHPNGKSLIISWKTILPFLPIIET